MALKQTRRSISVRGDTYRILREYAKLRDMSMSEVVEMVLAREMTASQISMWRQINAGREARRGMPAPTPASQVVAARPKEVF